MRRDEDALPAGKRGQGEQAQKQTVLTQTHYHATNENASYFRKGLADTAVRSLFPRTNLTAVLKDRSEPTSPRASYPMADRAATALLSGRAA